MGLSCRMGIEVLADFMPGEMEAGGGVEVDCGIFAAGNP